MDALSPKDLAKLAAVCRKAGIKQYKGNGVEFTLTDEAPVSNYKRTTKNKAIATSPEKAFQTDALTQESLMFWSSDNQSEDISEES